MSVAVGGLTGRWVKVDGRWGVRVDGATNVGETIEVRRRDGQTAIVKLLGVITDFPSVTYFVDEISESVQESAEAIPTNGELKRGDMVAKTINGVVQNVETRNAIPMVDILWDLVIRKQSMMACEVAVEDGQDTTGEQGDVEPLKKQIEALQAELELARKEAGVVEIRLKSPEGETVKAIKDTYHEVFKDVCDLLVDREEVFLWGPTGCGKSHLAKQAAELLGLRFAFISCTAGMSEGQITGRLLPVGKNGMFEYVSSEFVDCYENGGVFLLDEVDAADPNVMLVINAALANGHLALPNRPKKPVAMRHKDFVCVGAANTVGTGADRMYSGRNKLDTAFMERFACKIYMNYDERVDAICCPDETLRNRLLAYRKNIMDHRLERALSTRWMGKAYRRYKAGWSFEKIDTMFFQGWRDDEVSKAKGGVR